jgi:hypothetical protein
MTETQILETWLKWLRNGEWQNVTDDIERLLLELERDICWCGVPLTKPDIPTKIFGPNLEQILNAAGFYRREWVALTHADLMKEFGYTDELLRNTAYGVEKIIKDKNT